MTYNVWADRWTRASATHHEISSYDQATRWIPSLDPLVPQVVTRDDYQITAAARVVSGTQVVLGGMWQITSVWT